MKPLHLKKPDYLLWAKDHWIEYASETQGVAESIVSRLLRHSDPRMIKRYGKYEVATLEKTAGLVRRLK